MIENESDTRIALRFRRFKISLFVILERKNAPIRPKRWEIPIEPLAPTRDSVGIFSG